MSSKRRKRNAKTRRYWNELQNQRMQEHAAEVFKGTPRPTLPAIPTELETALEKYRHEFYRAFAPWLIHCQLFDNQADKELLFSVAPSFFTALSPILMDSTLLRIWALNDDNSSDVFNCNYLKSLVPPQDKSLRARLDEVHYYLRKCIKGISWHRNNRIGHVTKLAADMIAEDYEDVYISLINRAYRLLREFEKLIRFYYHNVYYPSLDGHYDFPFANQLIHKLRMWKR